MNGEMGNRERGSFSGEANAEGERGREINNAQDA